MSAAIASLSSTTNTTSTNNNDVIDEEEQQLLATIKKSEARICGHMNEDHETSLLAYARFYAKLNNAVRPIKMVQMTPEGFVLDVTLQNNDGTTELKKGVVVKYPNGRMTKASQAHLLAISMHNEAFDGLGLFFKMQNGYYQSKAKIAMSRLFKDKGFKNALYPSLIGLLALGLGYAYFHHSRL